MSPSRTLAEGEVSTAVVHIERLIIPFSIWYSHKANAACLFPLPSRTNSPRPIDAEREYHARSQPHA
eukprot:6203597-Pleurochrysis_carterae.AAC.2